MGITAIITGASVTNGVIGQGIVAEDVFLLQAAGVIFVAVIGNDGEDVEATVENPFSIS